MNGSDPLEALRPLHTPPPVPWWPPAPGWWLLGVAVIVVVLAMIWWRRRGVLRRAALRELDTLQSASHQPSQLAAAVNRLLKRYALACNLDPAAASLTGEPWLAFLDAHGGGGAFCRGPARALSTLAYGDQQAGTAQEVAAILTAARHWIKVNRPRGRH